MTIPWLNENIKDLKKRSVNLKSDFKNGTILILISKRISLFKLKNGDLELIKENIIDYEKIAKERSIEQRLGIIIDSMYEVNEFFYIEESLVDRIICGFTK